MQGLGAHPILANRLPGGRRGLAAARGRRRGHRRLRAHRARRRVRRRRARARRPSATETATGSPARRSTSRTPRTPTSTRCSRARGERGLTAFAVPRASEGLSGEPLSLLSPHPIGRLVFDGVPVPADHVLGEVDQGFKVAMRTLDLFRPSVGAFAVGMAQAALDAAVAHVTTREAFGRTLSQLQGVSHQLADVATAVQAARLLVHSAASAYDHGVRPTTKAAAMAKLFATETAQRAIDVADPGPRRTRPRARATSSSTSTGRSGRRASTRVPRRSSARSSPASSSAAPSRSRGPGRDSAGRALVSL